MNKLIKSPLVYQGSKYNLLNEILPLFPKNIKTFVDLFGGSGVVSLNVKADKVIYNEYNFRIKNIINTILHDNSYVQEQIQHLTNIHNLEKTKRDYPQDLQEQHKQRYLDFRKFVNESQEVDVRLKTVYHYLLHLFSFNSLIRFNKKAEFNASYGFHSGRNIRVALELLENIKGKHIGTQGFSFDEWLEKDPNNISKGDFIYCDPPYLNTTAVYNEKRLTEWEEKDEIKLLKVLDSLNEKGIKWGMSNTISGKEGQHNEILKEWMKKYKVHYFDKTYQVFGHSNKKI